MFGAINKSRLADAALGVITLMSISMELDDKVRGKAGVVCSMRDCGDGNIRINLDDVSNMPAGGLGEWQHQTLV